MVSGGLTFQVSDEGDGLDGVACVGEGLDDVVLHHTDHTEAWLVTWKTDSDNKRNQSLLCCTNVIKGKHFTHTRPDSDFGDDNDKQLSLPTTIL